MSNVKPIKQRLVPNTLGTDVDGPEYGVDGHIRVEEDKIKVDIFDRNIKDPDEAWIATEEFDNSPGGIREANQFLDDEGFNTELVNESEKGERPIQAKGENGKAKRMCPEGEEWVEEYDKADRTHVRGYCRAIRSGEKRRDRRR